MSRASGVCRLLLAPLVVVLVALPWSDRVSAHTDVDFTVPTDGASVGEPVHEVTVAFTSPVTLVGDAFEALDPLGNVLRPAAATTDDTVFILQFDPPLAGGDVGVRYEVRAEDGHVVSGSFSFTVDAPAPTTTVTTAVTTTIPPTVPSTTASPPVTGAASPTIVAATPSTSTPEPPSDAVDVAAGAGEVVDPDSVTTSTDDDGSGTGVIIALAAVVAVGAAGFLLVRSRTGSA